MFSDPPKAEAIGSNPVGCAIHLQKWALMTAEVVFLR